MTAILQPSMLAIVTRGRARPDLLRQNDAAAAPDPRAGGRCRRLRAEADRILKRGMDMLRAGDEGKSGSAAKGHQLPNALRLTS